MKYFLEFLMAEFRGQCRLVVFHSLWAPPVASHHPESNILLRGFIHFDCRNSRLRFL